MAYRRLIDAPGHFDVATEGKLADGIEDANGSTEADTITLTADIP